MTETQLCLFLAVLAIITPIVMLWSEHKQAIHNDGPEIQRKSWSHVD